MDPRDDPGREAPAEAEPPGPVVVGIGASAGGFAALKKLFAHVRADTGLAYVVVVHLSPDQKSHLAELLQPNIEMPVQQVNETIALEANRVYVIPPNANLESIDTHLRLSPLEERRQERAPIDRFFRTLASSHDGRAIGVVLTGTGHDGALGVKEIKLQGGLTVVQDPTEAEYDGMPRSAIATGVVDLVLPLEQIPEAVVRFAHTRPRIGPVQGEDVAAESEQLLHKIFAHIRVRTGRDFSRYKRSTMLRRIARRMQLHQVEDLARYLELVRNHATEVEALADDLLITVTGFFRDPQVFQKLEQDVLPAIFAKQGDLGDVRVWSVGCATGEEAYSLAMLLQEEAARRESTQRIQVFASDLHAGSLARAREGFYAGDIEADVSAERLRRCFHKEDRGYRVRRENREMVVFAPHNLLSDPPFSRLDLILCRNLLIYLQRDIQRDVIELFHYALRPGGFLVVGTSESVDDGELFVAEDKSLGIYRKRNVPAPEPRLPVFPLTRGRGSVAAAADTAEPIAYGALHQRMVEQYALPSILVGPEDKVIHLSEHAGRYLVHPGGELTASVFKLVREELRMDLRSLLHAARDRRQPVRSPPICMRFDGDTGVVVLHARPALHAPEAGFMLVIFDEEAAEADATAAAPPRGDVAAGEAGEHRHERAELELTRRRLQESIEHYETSQEEMKASNEELQSANEELRSTMEELETSKEELQSMNEELQTLNQENRLRVEELAQLTGDLQNLLAATEIATLFLDSHLRIMRFTPKVAELFNIRPSDRGRPLADFTHRLGDDALLSDAQAVFGNLVPIEREVEDDAGRWYLARVLPYRSTDERIEGVVVTLVDISQRKAAELALLDSERQFRVLVEAASQAVWEANPDGVVVADSPARRAYTGQSSAEWLGYGWLDSVHPEDREFAERRWREAVAAGRNVDAEFRMRGPDGTWRWTNVRAAPVRDAEGRVTKWVAMNLDITHRKQAEEALRDADRRKDEFLATLAHELRNPLAAIRNGLALMRVEGLAPEMQASARDMMDRQIGQLVRLIDDLLDVNRINRGVIALRRSVVDLVGIVRRAAQTARPRTTDHRLELALPAEPLPADVDPVRMAQVIGNLVDNAYKFTAPGQPILVSARREDEHAVVTVADEGVGIPRDKLAWIFEMFTQVESPQHGCQAGLGLGLALAKRLVELHGGTLEASSDGPDEGSTFTLRLPLVAAVALEPRKEEPDSSRPLRDLRILVVDDNRDAARSLAMVFEIRGNEVRTAHDGPQAVQAAELFQPQVVLLDIGLPGFDGHEVAKRIRAQPWGRDMVLVAVTGWGQRADEQLAAAAGFDAHVVKPVDPCVLERIVAKLRTDGTAESTGIR